MMDVTSPLNMIAVVTLFAVVLIIIIQLRHQARYTDRIDELTRQVSTLTAHLENHTVTLVKGQEAQEQLRIGSEAHTAAIEAMRRDLVHLADDVRGEVGTSKAIEMARGGASVDDITAKTGMPREQVEAIVTFHGR